MHPTEILRLFDEWEERTRGAKVYPDRTRLEPAFAPLFPTMRTPKPIIDDARKPGILDRLRLSTSRQAPQEPFIERQGREPATSGEMVEFELLLPAEFTAKSGLSMDWLTSLRSLFEPLSFEVIGLPDRVVVQLACGIVDAPSIKGSLLSFFPEAKLRERTDFLRQEWERGEGYGIILGFCLKERVYRELRTEGKFDIDPLIGIIGELSRYSKGEFGLLQVLVVPAKEPWGAEFENFALSTEDEDNALPLIRSKFSGPVVASVFRVATVAADKDRASVMARSLAYAVSGATRSDANELVLADSGGHTFAVEAEDLLGRATHRSGMLLSLSELMTLFHLPSASVRSERLARQGRRTKAAPVGSVGHGLVLGTNEHDEETRTVSLPLEDRLRHTYVIGASGTGKSTLLLSMVTQDIAAGNGFAVLDPHGDLIEDIMARIPEERVRDVIVFDPADEAYPVGFNILSAHSELERTLLASDLVAVFKRLSTSFGDQMVAVLGNAILAFLESTEGGTLLDLRRFLFDKSFRARFLETVQDEQVVSYWQEEFTLLKGVPHSPILTRLNTFLRSKLIRHMVAQKKDRLDMRAIMDGKKILLVKLSQGGIGEENSHLLGSLIVAKIAQAAMSRQDEAATNRVPFFLYIDEFHHFITPSLASILSGARKYRLGLTLAHQEMRQLKSRSEEVASAVLGNAYTRIVFRVGDQDAKILADGFSFFEAKDLQNLGIGEAIARIERPDFDFNLQTSLLPHVFESAAQHRRRKVVDASRTSFAMPRAEVEAILRAKRAEEESDEVAKPRPSRRSSSPKADSGGASAPENPKGRLPGRGGPQHKYLQSLIRKLAEDRGFNVIVEKRVLDGHGHVDVSLDRDGLTIGCEISISTGAEHEMQNLSKCLAAGFKYVVLVSPEERTLSEARSHFEGTDKERIRFLSPDAFIEFLDEFRLPVVPVREKLSVPSGKPEQGAGVSDGRRMLIAEDAAAYLGLAPQTLAKLRWSGESPPYFKVGRRVLYDREELDAWLNERKRRSTSDKGRK